MREYDRIVSLIYGSIHGAVESGIGDKAECLRLINWVKQVDPSEYMHDPKRWSSDAIRWDVIKAVKEKMGFRKECPTCLEDDSQFIDYVERSTLPDVMIVKCNKCDTQYGY